MRVLVTGATGYIGGRLVPTLVAQGHDVRVLVRDASRVPKQSEGWEGVEVVEGDLLDAASLAPALAGMEAAYYLVHSMGDAKSFEELELRAADNFVAAAKDAGVRHVLYLGGLQPPGEARQHLRSRAEVGRRLAALPLTEFQAGPVVGSGSASFEIVRYLTERLPVMLTPRWVDHRVDPIAIRDVLTYLTRALETGPLGVVPIGSGAIRFRDMMEGYARVRGLRRRLIVKVPVFAPTLAARWVQFITPVTNRVAVPVIDGMREDLVADTTAARSAFPDVVPMPYEEAVALAIARTEGDLVPTRWSSAHGAAGAATPFSMVDEHNLKREARRVEVAAPPEAAFAVVASLGGKTGWLAWDWAWQVRGAVDRMVGGPGLRRGRRSSKAVRVGDAVDFWRVEAVEPPHLLLLRAEMKVPGKAWLRFEVVPGPDGSTCTLIQTALFEPRGMPGWAYWNVLYPVHRQIFRAMPKAIAKEAVARG
ncbi:MAG: SDR family oxidoreductase [Thermoplasmatota archaeon]